MQSPHSRVSQWPLKSPLRSHGRPSVKLEHKVEIELLMRPRFHCCAKCHRTLGVDCQVEGAQRASRRPEPLTNRLVGPHGFTVLGLRDLQALTDLEQELVNKLCVW